MRIYVLNNSFNISYHLNSIQALQLSLTVIAVTMLLRIWWEAIMSRHRSPVDLVPAVVLMMAGTCAYMH